MQNILLMYPLVFLTIVYFILGYTIGNLIDKYMLTKCKESSNIHILLFNVFIILFLLVVVLFVSTNLTTVFKEYFEFDEKFVDVTKFIFGYALFQSQDNLKYYMNELNTKTIFLNKKVKD
tara:strand:+ start:124 stop:483 length:360 start_codon:yes stop_codon:yes gene_type:complete